MSQFFGRVLSEQNKKKTFLCVGLDPDLSRLPEPFGQGPNNVFAFLKAIVDATVSVACCFKPQAAYFAALGAEQALFEIIGYIRSHYPDTPVILDSKRNDIGTTAEMYSREAFERFAADAVTVSPYMGGDTIEPFSQRQDKGVFVLCRTSNPGAKEFQNLSVGDGEPLYLYVAERALRHWNKNDNIGLVVGATATSELRKIRQRFPEAWFLVPGVGAQGGDLASVIEYGRRADGPGGLIINASRSILYASSGSDFAEKAFEEAQKLQKAMAQSFKTP